MYRVWRFVSAFHFKYKEALWAAIVIYYWQPTFPSISSPKMCAWLWQAEKLCCLLCSHQKVSEPSLEGGWEMREANWPPRGSKLEWCPWKESNYSRTTSPTYKVGVRGPCCAEPQHEWYWDRSPLTCCLPACSTWLLMVSHAMGKTDCGAHLLSCLTNIYSPFLLINFNFDWDENMSCLRKWIWLVWINHDHPTAHLTRHLYIKGEPCDPVLVMACWGMSGKGLWGKLSFPNKRERSVCIIFFFPLSSCLEHRCDSRSWDILLPWKKKKGKENQSWRNLACLTPFCFYFPSLLWSIV